MLLAQQPFEFIYHDAEDKRDSIIDFGATLPGTQLYKTVVIKNVSNQTIWLETSTIEWYSIQLDPSNTISGTFREYGGPYRYPITPVATGFFDNGEVILPPGASDTMLIRFNSDTVGDQQMTGRKTGFLDLIVRRYPFKDRTNEIAKRRFFLTTIKTKKLLAVRRDTVHFDSVYVGTTAFEDWSVLNASRLSVDAHQLYPASSEFLVPQPIANIPPGPSFDFPVRINYTPTNRGSDEAEVAAEYTLPGGIEKDTVRSIIKGFGAEQQLNVSAARMNALPIHIIDNVLTPDAGDTIYIGDVRVGRNIEIELDIVNVGNINFQAVKDTILLSGRADYSIEQPF
ncbi:MAG TPA: hypothetical protein VEC36_08845, partial [Patescibacteria group bacterium]|nr:hypothetical protein [Patescibacteria group bacterium]